MQHTFSTSPKLIFEAIWPVLLPSLEVPRELAVGIQKDTLGVHLFIEKKLSKEAERYCLSRI